MGSSSAPVSKQLYALYFALPTCHEQTFFLKRNLCEIVAEIFGESGPEVI